MKYDSFSKWIEAKQNQSNIQMRIEVLKKWGYGNHHESLKTCGQIINKLFNEIICTRIHEYNPSLTMNKELLSLEGINKGKDIAYDLEDIMKHYTEGCTFIHDVPSCDNKPPGGGGRVTSIVK